MSNQQNSSSSSSNSSNANPSANALSKSDLIDAFKTSKLLSISSSHRSKVESIYAFSDKVLVGLNNGTLLVYVVEDPLSPNPGRVTLRKTIKNFAPRAIEKIGFVKDAGSLIVLSDGVVHVYDLESWTLDETLNKTKGATTFDITFGVKNERKSTAESEIVPVSEDTKSKRSVKSDHEDDEDGGDEGHEYMSTVTRLVVACKRKLLCYEWWDSEFLEFKEVTLPDRIRSLSFVTVDKLVCGLNSDYCIIDIPSSKVSNIVLPGTHSHSSFTSVGISYIGMGIGGRSPTPHATALPDKSALLVKDVTSQFIYQTGDLILDRPGLSLTTPVEHLGYSYPYVLTVFPKTIEVRNPATASLLQTIEITGVKSIYFGKVTYAATTNSIYRLQGTNLQQQVSNLAERGHLSEAISILEAIDSAYISSKPELLREFKIKKAKEMLTVEKDFEKALILFSEVSTPPEKVVQLFPKEISGTAEDLIRYTNKISQNASSTANELLTRSIPRKKKGRTATPQAGDHSNTVYSPESDHEESESSAQIDSSKDKKEKQDKSEWTEKELSTAIRYLVNYLADTRRKISLLSSHQVPQKQTDTTGETSGNESEESQNTQTSAIEALSAAEPTEHDEPIISNGVILTRDIFGDLKQAADLVDTTMFKAYIIQSPALIGPLLRIHNHCEPETVKTILSNAGRWRELIDFYFGKKLHREALELLKTLATSESPSDSHLHGPEPTVQYLQRLNNKYIDLIFEFARLPIEMDEQFGVEIFLEESTESESLDRTKVLVFLESISRRLSIKYLENLIFEKSEENPYFHTALAICYIKELGVAAKSANEKQSLPSESSSSSTDLENALPTSLLLNQKKFGQQSSAEAAAAIETKRSQEEYSEGIFNRLVTFLEDRNSKYRLQRVLSSLPLRNSECIPEEIEVKAILYGRQGEIRKALMIYTFSLKDDSKARAFCSKLCEENAKLGNKALHTLMALYLTPPTYREIDDEEEVHVSRSRKGSPTETEESSLSSDAEKDSKSKHPKQRLDLALDLLATQGSRMSVVEIINTLPSDTKIHDIGVFLTSQIRTLRTSWNNTQLDSALRKVNLVKTQEALLTLQQRSITITPIKTCKVCFKRLGQSVISVFPDGTAIHYGCARAYQTILDDVKKRDEEEKRKKEEVMKRSMSKKATGDGTGTLGDVEVAYG